MQPNRPVREDSLGREVLDLVRGPLIVAAGIGLGFEALVHLVQTIAVVLILTVVTSVVGFVRRGRAGYPALHDLLASKTKLPFGRRRGPAKERPQ